MSAWTSREAAVFLQMTRKGVCAQAAAGAIPGVKIGRDWKFDETTLREWLQQKTRENLRAENEPCQSTSVQIPRIGKSSSGSLGARLDALLEQQTAPPQKHSKSSFAVLSGGKSSSARSTTRGTRP